MVKDVIRGGEYCVVDRGLSVYANIDEFKNNYFICSQLTTYEDVSFFDNTLLVEKNNQKVKNYFDKIDSGVSEVQVAFFCFLNQTTELKLAKGER